MAISIGQLANERRKLTTVFAGIGIWFAEFFLKRTIQKILHLSFYGGLVDMAVGTTAPDPRVTQTILLSLITELAFFAIETFVTWLISSRKIWPKDPDIG